MIKIIALNEETVNTKNEIELANTITKEAQEQIAFNEYNRALQLLINGEKEEALNVLKDLLDTELLDNVEKPLVRDGRSRPLLSLKYSCFKNIASVQEELKNYHEALQNYWEAANLDDTDVLLWYRIGNMAIETYNLETACLAFKQGLQRNSHHWPSLDKMITVLYAIPDYMTCLLYISIAFERDSSYVKGLAFRERILKNHPLLIHSYKVYNSNWDLDPPLDVEFNKVLGDSLIEEANELSKKWIEFKTEPNANKCLSDLTLTNSLTEFSWLELGKGLINTYKYMFNNNLHFIRPIVLPISESFGSSIKHDSYESNIKCNDDEELYKKTDSRSPSHDNISIMNNLQVDRSFNISTNQNCDITELDDKNKCFPNDIPIFEDEADRIDVNKDFSKDSDENNTNTSENKEENNLPNLKYCEKGFNEKDDYKVNNDDSEKSNGKLNDKLSENDGSNRSDLKDKGQKVKKRRRSSLCILKQWAWSSNNANRTSRSRNTTNRKDYERDGVVLEETLKRIFPSTLLPDNTKCVKDDYLKNNEDSMDTMDLYYLSINKENNNFAEDTKSTESSKPPSPADVDQLKYFGTEQENIDVKLFIEEHSSKSNIMLIISKFIEILCSKWNYEWSDELPEIYIDLYTYLREHVPHFSPFYDDIDEFSLKVDEEATLLYCEFYLDKWLSTKPCTLPGPSSNKFGIGISSDDLGDLLFCSCFDNTHSVENTSFLLRLLWLKANIFLYQGDVDISLRTLELLLDYMQQWQNKMNKIFLKLTNCKYNSFIDVRSVEKMITFIQRSKQICEIKRLHQQKKYEELSIILKDTFNFSKQTNQFLLCNEAPIDRTEHLKILLDSLWQLKQYEDCFMWGEVCLNECWQNYLNAICLYEEERIKWTALILYCFEKLHGCVEEVSTFVVKLLPSARRSRFVQNLVQIVCHQLDVVDNTPKMPIESVLPWILLHFILQYEEDKQRAKSTLSSKNKSANSLNVESDEDEEDIPASVTILLKAHEFLGRHGWCCVNEGHLLIYIMKLVIPKLHFPLYHSIKHKLKLPLEQIIYCLYGHPSKLSNGGRLRPKYVEHVKEHITLDWETCQLMFEFYKPENLPNFESNRINSINADTVALFKKICCLIPQDSNPTFIEKEMNSYLLGNIKNMPSIKTPLPDSISYIYYYIADHYFKAASNNFWPCAIKYYTLDLCIHPHEVNSWAGLAMATSTLMETWLNNFEPNTSEEKYLSKAKLAERSYQNAIKLEPDHLTIMTEFGNFLYTVHSYCSRLLKQESDSLNMERFGILEARKEQMLDEAKNCFERALNIYAETQGIGEPQDERWLYHYMLAKIAEKKNEDPPLFLQHYAKANQLLYENSAQYPKRINHKNPQNLAIEALEVYYRIHASIIKYLEQHEGKPIKKSLATLFEKSLKYCMQVPFMAYNSIFVSTINEKSNTETTLTEVKPLNSAQECEINKTSMDKCDNRKRSYNESTEDIDAKRMKSTSVSHLQLMHDVVALIDDLITKVCNNVRTSQTPINDDNIENKSSISSNSNVKVVVSDKSKDFVNNSNKQDTTLKLKKEQSNQENDFKKEQILKSAKVEEKKKITKDGVLSRRGSQESTTTTHTSTSETNNSTSSSSDDSSSSEDSSGSSDSSDSDSDSNESEVENLDTTVIKEEQNASEEEINKLIKYCIAGLEQCSLRFPEHYKSTYRLAYFYFSSKFSKNLSKCKELLLGSYECQFFPKQTIQGLFSEKKTANFFNGIWRIPNNEIDRPGSFASHMSRCIILLMQVLKETGDSRMLTEVCIQLKKIPDTDKKYLRDSEREQLSSQALMLCLQCLRNRIQALDSKKVSVDFQEEHTKLLLDIYHTYGILKSQPEYTSEMPKVKKLLEDAYLLLGSPTGIQANVFDLARDYCLQKRHDLKIGNQSISKPFDPNRTMGSSNIMLPTTNVNTNFNTNINASITNSTSFLQSRKSHKVSTNSRPRGRPPGVNKFTPIPSNDSLFSSNQNIAKNFPDSGIRSSDPCNAANNNPFLNPFLDPILAMNYITQIGAYQDILQRYQNSFSGFNLNLNKNISSNVPNIQPVNKPVSTDGCLNIANDRPDISITPVTDNIAQKKSKTPKMPTNPHQNDSMFVQLSKSVQITPTSHFPVAKQSQKRSLPSTDRHTNLMPSTMVKDSGLSVNRVTFPQTDKNVTENVGSAQGMLQPNISLQHKLLSKKQYQHPSPSPDELNFIKRQKLYKSTLPVSPHKNQSDTASINRVNFSQPDKTATETMVNSRISNPYADINVTPLSVKSFASTKYNKTSITPLKISKPKLPSADVSLKPMQSTGKVNAPSVLSQLQQHSHLEIIPQTNYVKPNVDQTSFFGKSTVIQSLPKSSSTVMQNLPKPTSAMMQNLPKSASSVVQNLPKSTSSVVQNLPKSTSSVVQNLPKSASSVVQNLAKSAPSVAQNLPKSASSLVQNLPKSTSSLVQNMPKSASSVVQNMPKSASSVVQNLPKSVNISSNDSVSIYELPRRSVNNINLSTTPQVPKRDKLEKNDVEIITLDD